MNLNELENSISQYADLEITLNKYLSIETNPTKHFYLDRMGIGVKKDIDREYTYDIVPKELEGGILYQTEHRVLAGTSIELTIHKPLTLYFIFHDEYDGNYTNIFKNLDDWEMCDTAPQYDVNCKTPNMETHGMNQTMYKLKAKEKTTYSIPTSEQNTNSRGWSTWNMVMVEDDKEK